MILAKKLLMGINKPSKPYLEFVSSTPMAITPKYTNSGVTLQYSLNGSSWTTIASGATTPSANVIYFRGQATGTKALFTSGTGSNAWTFSGATNLECNGKLDRLIQNALGDDEDILIIGNYCFAYMLNNVRSLIYVDTDCLPATTLVDNCYQNMFSNCTSLTTPPSLPATTLAKYCYQFMFSNCTSLTTVPSLPATTLPQNCYQYMFYNCTSLKISTSSTGIYDTPYRIPTIGSGSGETSSLDNMFKGTGGTFKGTPTIYTIYYTENTPV